MIFGTNNMKVAGPVWHYTHPYADVAVMKSEVLELRPEPGNIEDNNAIAIVRCADNERVGYVPRPIAAKLQSLVIEMEEKGVKATAKPCHIVEGQMKYGPMTGYYGVVEMNIRVEWVADHTKLDTIEKVVETHSFLVKRMKRIKCYFEAATIAPLLEVFCNNTSAKSTSKPTPGSSPSAKSTSEIAPLPSPSAKSSSLTDGNVVTVTDRKRLKTEHQECVEVKDAEIMHLKAELNAATKDIEVLQSRLQALSRIEGLREEIGTEYRITEEGQEKELLGHLRWKVADVSVAQNVVTRVYEQDGAYVRVLHDHYSTKNDWTRIEMKDGTDVLNVTWKRKYQNSDDCEIMRSIDDVRTWFTAFGLLD